MKLSDMSRADLYRVVVANALVAGVDSGTAANAGCAAVAAGGGASERVAPRDQRALEKLVKPWGTEPETVRATAREFLAYQARRHRTSEHALLGAVAAKLGVALDGARGVALADLARPAGPGTGKPAAPTFSAFSGLPTEEQVRVLDGALDEIHWDDASGFAANSRDLDTRFSPWAKPTVDAFLERLGPDRRVTVAKRGTLFGPADAPFAAAAPGTPEAYGYQEFADYIEIQAVIPSRDEMHRVRAFFLVVDDTHRELGALSTVASRAELRKSTADLAGHGAALVLAMRSDFTTARFESAFEKNDGLTIKERFALMATGGELIELIKRDFAEPGPLSADWNVVATRLERVDELLHIWDLNARASLLPFSRKGLNGNSFAEAAKLKAALLAQHFESALRTVAYVGDATIPRKQAPTSGEIELAHRTLEDLDTMLWRATREHRIAVPAEWQDRLASLAPMRARIAQLRAFNPLRRAVAD